MVNLLAVDAQKIQDMVIYTNTFLDIPLHVILGLLCIWLEVGWACLAGIGVMAVLLPLNVFVIANQSRKLQVRSHLGHIVFVIFFVKNIDIKDEQTVANNRNLSSGRLDPVTTIANLFCCHPITFSHRELFKEHEDIYQFSVG